MTDRSLADRELIRLAQAGDEQALGTVTSLCLRLMRSVASKIPKEKRAGIEIDDLVQEGMVNLLKMLPKYDESRSSFSHFAWHCAHNAMLSHIKMQRRQWRAKRLGGEPCDAPCSPSLHDALESLSDTERWAVMLRHGLDGGGEHTNAEIGELLRMPPRAVAKLIRMASAKLRRHLAA